MAYVDQPTTTDQDKLNPQSPLNQPPTTGGGAVGTATGGDKTPNQPSSSVAPAPFTNLGSYLQVNAPQIQGMAEKVAGQLGQTYETAKGAVDTGASAIQNQINAGYAAPNQALVEQAAANPTEFAANPENVAAFQAQYGNKYTGPASAEVTPDYATAQGAVQNAVNEAANVGNYGGLQSYLTKNLATNPTQAISALDTALLNQSPEAIAQVNAAAQRFPGLSDYFNQMIAQQNQNIAGAQTAAQTGAQAAQNRFTGEGGVVPTYENTLTNRVNDLRNKMAGQESTLLNYLKQPSLAVGTRGQGPYPADILAGLNMTNDSMASLAYRNAILRAYGNTINPTTGQPFFTGEIDFSKYANPINPEVGIQLQNAATPEDYAKFAALQLLTGNDLGNFLNQENLAQAGQTPTNYLNFDYNKAREWADTLLGSLDQERLRTHTPMNIPGYGWV